MNRLQFMTKSRPASTGALELVVAIAVPKENVDVQYLRLWRDLTAFDLAVGDLVAVVVQLSRKGAGSSHYSRSVG